MAPVKALEGPGVTVDGQGDVPPLFFRASYHGVLDDPSST
jgi:hypothetical protein